MSLITCPECGKVFSDRAAHCPQCGLPTADALKDIAAQNGGVVPTVNTDDNSKPVAATTGNDSEAPAQVAAGNSAPVGGQEKQPEFTRQDYDHIPSSMPTGSPRQGEALERGVSTPPDKPGRQGSLMMYILIVAVVVLAIVCIAMIANSGSGNAGDFDGDDDSIGTVTTLPADTLPQQTQMMDDIKQEPVRAAEEPEPEFTEETEGTAEGENATPAEPNATNPAPASTAAPATTPQQHTPAQPVSTPAQGSHTSQQ